VFWETHKCALRENAEFVNVSGSGECSSHVKLTISCLFIGDKNEMEVGNVRSVDIGVFYRKKV